MPPRPVHPDSNQACARCHPVQAEALASSRHARANESDVFVALRARLAPAEQRFCDQCHAAHDLPGERGIGCVTCHRAVGNQGVSNARLRFDPTGPLRGPFADPAPTTAHGSQRSDFLTSSDLCGTCHEVAGPGAFVETPYREWIDSPAARAGITCARCHMSRLPGNPRAQRTQGPAARDPDGATLPIRALSDHRFVGPDDDHAQELLAEAAALQLHLGPRTDSEITVEVEVHNRNEGHALPAGARFAREVWLEVSVRDARGTVHTLTGGLTPEGAPLPADPRRVDFGDLVTHAGAFALPMDADRHTMRAIPAGERVRFPFTVPLAPEGVPATAVRARLRYRRYAFALRAALGLPATPNPIFDLAEAEHAL